MQLDSDAPNAARRKSVQNAKLVPFRNALGDATGDGDALTILNQT
jgi:hypothetical protein